MDQYQFPSITLAATVKDQQNINQDHVDSSTLPTHHLECTTESKSTTFIYQIYQKVSNFQDSILSTRWCSRVNDDEI